jgi:hypothetical protein
MDVPLILTLALEENAFEFFNALRKIYFPADKNQLEAHLTLFHLLPNEPLVVEVVERTCTENNILLLQVIGPSLTGNGVAYKIESDELMRLHGTLQQQWKDFLIPQDLQKLWPHITIQNKVSPEEAKELLDFLTQNFSSFTTQGTGLQLWEYHGGPWKLFREFDFTRN